MSEPEFCSSIGILRSSIGDDVACSTCGEVALDTGLECTECGHDMFEELMGYPFELTPE